ncbi:hypothetical protein [Trueperella bialowiezensis]|uniref:DUF732 domain-containing protein n=1 Tax=Trueperella bialowiezensis TaxID=312285 RepID=A0A448PF24_9ACTO|nr:hypothetical protein [Trueperella bialowiezensis]VEI13516.1 Uncharacterised protein [Trueperella bialowiezensis]
MKLRRIVFATIGVALALAGCSADTSESHNQSSSNSATADAPAAPTSTSEGAASPDSNPGDSDVVSQLRQNHPDFESKTDAELLAQADLMCEKLRAGAENRAIPHPIFAEVTREAVGAGFTEGQAHHLVSAVPALHCPDVLPWLQGHPGEHPMPHGPR